MKKLTREELDNRLKGRGITLLFYSGCSYKKSQFLCEKCDYVWWANSNEVAGKNKRTGCRKCSGLLNLTKKDCEDRLKPRGIVILKYGGNVSAKSTFKNLDTGEVWEAMYSNVIKGCESIVARGKFTTKRQSTPQEEVVKKLHKHKYVELVSYGGTMGSVSVFRNKVTGEVWESSVNNLLQRSGEIFSKAKVKLTEQEVRERLDSIGGITLIKYGGSVVKKSLLRDDETGFTWEVPVYRIFTGQKFPGTKYLRSSQSLKGFKDKVEVYYFYAFKLDVLGVSYICFGVTSDFKRRYRSHIKTVQNVVDENLKSLSMNVYKFSAVELAINLENLLKVSEFNVGIPNLPGFKTEALLYENEHYLECELKGCGYIEHFTYSKKY